MRTLHTAASLLLLTPCLFATTLIVDGSGDGDGDGTDNFDTVRDAVIELGTGVGTDGASDEIAIVWETVL